MESLLSPEFETDLWTMGVALVVTLIATPLVRRLSIALDLFDRPDGGLKPHQRAVPYMGGVGMYAGWLAALLTGLITSPLQRRSILIVLAGGTVLMLTGLVDDIRHIRPKYRLMIQGLVTAAMLLGGIGHHSALAIFEPLRGVLPAWCYANVVIGPISGSICLLAIAGACNSTNLIDGLDGLCAGVLAISATGFYLLHTMMSQTAGAEPSSLMPLVSAALLGATVGFLFYNFNPASIFMGDSGSLLLGFSVAVMLITLAEHPTPRWLAAGLAVFAFPIFDTALAITRRWMNGKPLLGGDRSHFYDQIRDRSLTVRQTALACYAIGIGSSALAYAIVVLPAWPAAAILVGVPILVALLCRRFGLLRVDDVARRH